MYLTEHNTQRLKRITSGERIRKRGHNYVISFVYFELVVLILQKRMTMSLKKIASTHTCVMLMRNVSRSEADVAEISSRC